MDSPLIHVVARGAQVLFAVVTFALSVHLVRGQIRGGAPVALGYGAFVGAASLVGAIVGIVGAVWVESLQGIITLSIDGFLTLANLAGGVLLAVQLKGTQCGSLTDSTEWLDIGMIWGGCHPHQIFELNEDCLRAFATKDGKKVDVNKYLDFAKGRCRESTADSAFMFLTLAVLLVTLTLTFLRRR